MSLISIEENKSAHYPSHLENYSPSTKYPEYSLPDIAQNKNLIYDMVRNALCRMELDKSNIGTRNWNPFGDFIKKNQTVLIKPNFVNHINKSSEHCENLDCLVTHPSVLRPIIDYCLLALKNTGRIIVADAPVQECSFLDLMEKNHINDLIKYYKNNGYNIELYDLRESGIEFRKKNTQSENYKLIDLTNNSLFSDLSSKDLANLRITNYDVKEIQKYHNKDHHTYAISSFVLDADVIINVPKPKTHKKGGVTLSLKNMFGCIAKKECLPHHTKGSKSNNGDEYKQKSLFKSINTQINEKQDSYILKHNKPSKILIFLKKANQKIQKLFSKKSKESEGSWHGNNTLWKTILDINRILIYSDKNGVLQDTPQRKMFIIADMIVGGQGNGPLCPTPHNSNLIICADNQSNFDKITCTIMGIDHNHIPTIKNSITNIGKYDLPYTPFTIKSNIKSLNDKCDTNFDFNLNYKPADNWENVIKK